MYEDAIILGIILGFSALICFIVYKMIKLKFSHDERIEEETFNRLAKAFIQHKKDTERRLKNLEAIISEEDISTGHKSSQKQISEPKQTIEIEDDERQPTTEIKKAAAINCATC